MHLNRIAQCLLTASVTFTAILNATESFAADNWPQLRGPGANPALADNPNLPETWSETENVEWVANVTGLGWSSPVVWGNRIFLTTVGATGDFERPKDGLYNGSGRPVPPDVEQSWYVYCFDLETGEVVWRRLVHQGKPEFPRHPKSTYASATPVTDGERVYTLFGDLGIFCFDFGGSEIWHERFRTRKTRNGYGAGASPVLHGKKLIVIYDSDEESTLSAYHTEIVTAGIRRNRSYDLDGNLLWEMEGRMSSNVIPTPFASHGMVYIESGYMGDEHRPAYAIRAGATGDISLKDGETSNDFIAWYQPLAGTYNTSPLVYDEYYYNIHDRGLFECYNALTGEQVYDRTKISKRGRATFTASPWAYNGKIFCLSEQGNTYVVKAGPEFELLGVNPLNEMCVASPAIVGDRVIIRTASKLYSIKKSG
jgi:outer membrane protein assembly factor BamB